MLGDLFSQIDFGLLEPYLVNQDVTDVSYSNGGQIWIKTLSQGICHVKAPGVDDHLMAKIAFQCANVMGKTFNMANPVLDAESSELRLNFVHESVATNGIAVLIRKTPAMIRLKKEKMLEEDYVSADHLEFLTMCVHGHCNILVSGETGSGKTEWVKYMASQIAENEKIITIEDTLELHLDRIFPHRDIVAMKTNNIASYTDVLTACMRQNPRWILLSEVRSYEAVMAVRNSVSSGHNILSTIHSDKAINIPHRLYSLLESNLDIDQFMKSIYRYIHLGVHIRAYQDKETRRMKREICEIVEFYVDDDNNPKHSVLYYKAMDGRVIKNNPSKYLINYMEGQGIVMRPDIFVPIIDTSEVETL